MNEFIHKKTNELEFKLENYKKNQLPVLVLGEEGSGKTHLLQQISKKNPNYFFSLNWVDVPDWKNIKKKLKDKSKEINSIILVDDIDRCNKEILWDIVKIKNESVCKWFFSSNLTILDRVKTNEFSKDFYSEISTQSLLLPSIRDLKSDISFLINQIVNFFCKKYKKKSKVLLPELVNFLLSYDYPSNWKDLISISEALVLFSTKTEISLKSLPKEVLNIHNTGKQRKLNIVPGLKMAEYEKLIITSNLELYSGNREKTAKSLGISERNLYRKIKEFDLP